jgi:hypothetical protein
MSGLPQEGPHQTGPMEDEPGTPSQPHEPAITPRLRDPRRTEPGHDPGAPSQPGEPALASRPPDPRSPKQSGPTPQPEDTWAPPAPPAPPPAGTDREPFWSYSDLILFIGLALPCMLVAFAIVKVAMRLLHVTTLLKVAELVSAQFLGYVLLFGSLALLFRIQHGRPFWRSLGWLPMRMPPLRVIAVGMAMTLLIVVVAALIRVPTTKNPMMELLQNRFSVILLAIFGVTLAPVCEELAFRGFLQPLLVRSFGAAPGILLAALFFGLLHFQEYGNSWKHVVLITLAGSGFGWVRHTTGSTKASALMHASYNALFFLALFASGKGALHE